MFQNYVSTTILNKVIIPVESSTSFNLSNLYFERTLFFTSLQRYRYMIKFFNILVLLSLFLASCKEESSYDKFQEELAKDPAFTFICYIDANYVANSSIQGISADTVMGHHGVGIFWNVADWTIGN